jgi:tRNA(His) 5'-end guanylyltransferase
MSETKELKEPKENIAKDLGDRIKRLERESEGDRLPRHRPFVVRLDGHKFSKFTKKMVKPYDEVFATSMLRTASDLVNEFNPRTVFTESDEITMVFHGIPEDAVGSTHIYDGRKQKICSLMAGFASTRFNFHFNHFNNVHDLIGRAYFDARVFSVANDTEAMEAVLWRQRDDTFRNGVNAIAQSMFSSRALHGKKLVQVMQMLREKNVLLSDYNPHLLFGTFFKKKLVEIDGLNPKTGETCRVTRGRVHTESNVRLVDMEDPVDFVMRKYW